MPENKDIAVLAKRVYELSALPVAELDARKWEALLVINAVYSSATPDGIARANADKEARWGDQIRDAGLLSALHPKWHLRTDDDQPPAARFALASALDNPRRDLRSRYSALVMLPADDREPLSDLARALVADAWDGAVGDARVEFSRTMSRISKRWTGQPWLALDPYDGSPPVLILIDHQGVINDGSMWDEDPTDDPLGAAWDNAIRTWDVDFLRDNPLAQLFTAATSVGETASDLARGANEAAKGVARILAWMPYVVAGVGAVGATAVIVAAVSRPSTVIIPAATPTTA